MKILTYALYKEHCELYIEIHGSNAVTNCHIEHKQKDIVLLSNVSVILYKAGSHTGVENNRFIKFKLASGTYSTDDFNEKDQGSSLPKKTGLGTTSN